MRVLVTGGNGFLGTNLVSKLGSLDHDVVSFDSAPPRAQMSPGTRWIQGDLNDLSSIRSAYDESSPSLVFHLAARTDLHGRTIEDYAANTIGTDNLITVMKDAGNKPFTVYASSRLVFAIDHRPVHDYDYKPSTPYGESKVAMERRVRDGASAAGDWALVRPTSLWGPWFGIPYRDFFDTVKSGRYVNVSLRSPSKSYGFVGNAVHELVALAQAPREATHEKVFWLSDYPPLELRNWAELIADEFGVKRPRTVPYWLIRLAAAAGDAAKQLGYSEPPITSFRLRNLLTNMVYDTSTTEAIVGPLPYSLNEGVSLTAEWIRSQQGSIVTPAATDR